MPATPPRPLGDSGSLPDPAPRRTSRLLLVAALLASGFFGAGYLRPRALEAMAEGGHWGGIARGLLVLLGVSVVLLGLALREVLRLARAGRGAPH